MSLQTDLQNAVAKATTDSGLLHQIVHGPNTEMVPTEGGPVKTIAKLLHDADERINLQADSILEQATSASDQAQLFAASADAAAVAAAASAARALPEIQPVDGGKEVRVNADATGYELVHTAMLLSPVFYGIKKAGNRLLVATSEQGGIATFAAKDYATAFFAPPGIQFSLQTNGHMAASF